jgi:AraC family transcriptional regulator of adaptative response / DNA-3-methyladenine glycosylase II
VIDDFETRYRAVSGRDARFDGMVITAVTSTGIYCRPSCPAITPKRANVRFYQTAAAAQAAGFRACKRCRPDASPGSPEWNVRDDLVARAMRLIADGVVDRDGVGGLAKSLHVSDRHLHRLLMSEVGAGPQALARAQRAQTARVLIETTRLRFSEIAFTAGFASIRQFNDTIREVFASTPSELRAAKRRDGAGPSGTISLRLAHRVPFDADTLFAWLGARVVAGVEAWDGAMYRRTLRLPHSTGVVELSAGADHVACVLHLGDVRDLVAAVHRCRRLLDLDADPIAIDETLGTDPLLRPLVARRPGLRVPGAVDCAELAVRAVVGQQISLRAARTISARLVAELGKPLTVPAGDLTHVWPEPEVLAEADLSTIGIPTARQTSIRSLATAIAAGDLAIDLAADRGEVRARLLELPGIGPWTTSYVMMRALGDPDAFMPTDLGVVRSLEQLGVRDGAAAVSERWKPWRAYAQQHLWAAGT